MAWTGESFDGLEGFDGGDDYAVGFTVQTTPLKGLDVDFVFAFQSVQCQDQILGFDGNNAARDRACPNQTIRVGRPGTDGGGLAQASTVHSEDRFFVGVDGRWKYGPFTVSPSFFYQFGERLTNRAGGAGRGKLDISSFLADVRAQYQTGPLTVQAKFVYTPGNKFTDALTGRGGDDEINFFQHIAIDTTHRSTDWFETLGFNHDTTSEAFFNLNDPRSPRSNLDFDQCGLIHVAVRGDYQITDKLAAIGAVGAFWTEENVGRPARFVTAPETYNYTGDDKYLGTELAVWLEYQIFPRTTVELWFDYTFIGDAFNLVDTATGNVAEAKDVVQGGTRMLYRF